MIAQKFAPVEDKMLFIIGQDLYTVKDFLEKVVPNPAGTTSYTSIVNNSWALAGLDSAVDYGSGTVCASQQVALAPHSCLALGLCIKDSLEDIVMHRCDAHIDRLGDWIRKFERPVFLRIGYEFDLPWNEYDPEYYKLAFKWIVSRLRFRGVTNFVSVWQSSIQYAYTYCRKLKKTIDRSFIDWYPGNDVVDWMGTSYLGHPKKELHDTFLNFARSKSKPIMIAESTPRGYDLECGHLIDEETNNCRRSDLTGKDIWNTWFEPFFKYIADNRDVIRAVAYINTPWKNQKMWNSGEHGYWGDSRVEIDDYIKEKFVKEITNSSQWLLASPEFKSKIDDRA